jgi:hypothetical protein
VCDRLHMAGRIGSQGPDDVDDLDTEDAFGHVALPRAVRAELDVADEPDEDDVDV